MYLVLEHVREFGIPVALTEANPGPDLKYLRGHKLDATEAPRNLRLVSDSPVAQLPDFVNAARAPVVSTRFREVLAGAGIDNVDYYDAPVSDPDREIQGFAVMNIVGLVSCLDWTQAKVTQFRGKVARMKHLAIDPAKTEGFRMFRLHEYPEIILVHEGVATQMSGLTGASLSEAEGWNDAHVF